MGKNKPKTVKSLSKRFRVTKNGKVKKIKKGQNHFNAKTSGKNTRNKRVDPTLSNSYGKTIKKFVSL